MGKQGPCFHCGVASTPLWRNGPPEKPVLCNACGSRWRTKGTLVNYTPLHARVDPGDYEDHRTGRMKSGSLKKKDVKLNKRKVKDEYTTASDREFSHEYSHQGRHNKYNVDEDMSTRSSFGSAVSNSESCAQFGSGADASELTGQSRSIVWDSVIPSRKRTCMTRPKQSSVEKLTKDLYTIYHEQASQFSGCSEEDLLYESDAPMVSVEIGHGSVLIRHPSTMVKEEESEASSLSVDNKLCRSYERYSNAASLMSINDSKSVSNSFSPVDEAKKLNGQIMQLVQPKREKFNHEKLQVLCNHKSPLSYIDLTEIVNFDVFQGHLTDEERQCLLKYLPSVDTSAGFDSFENIFASTHIKESLSSFQQLLADGVLDSSFSGFKPEDCKILKRLALCTASKFKWIEHYNTLKKQAEESTEELVSKTGAKTRSAGTLINGTKFRGNHNRNGAEAKFTVKTPERAALKAEHKKKATLQDELPTPKNIFSLPSTGVGVGGHLILDSSSMMHYEDEDDDLLLEVPSNGSFPQAELLCPTTSSYVSQQASACSSSTYPFNFRT